MLIGCALLAFGSCAALAQQDPTPAQGGSPNSPTPAVSTQPGAGMATGGGAMRPMAMKRPMMGGHRGMMMHHRRMMMHHRMMGNHHMMMHHKRMMMKHRMMHKMHRSM